jgi:hypothetical protein
VLPSHAVVLLVCVLGLGSSALAAPSLVRDGRVVDALEARGDAQGAPAPTLGGLGVPRVSAQTRDQNRALNEAADRGARLGELVRELASENTVGTVGDADARRLRRAVRELVSVEKSMRRALARTRERLRALDLPPLIAERQARSEADFK